MVYYFTTADFEQFVRSLANVKKTAILFVVLKSPLKSNSKKKRQKCADKTKFVSITTVQFFYHYFFIDSFIHLFINLFYFIHCFSLFAKIL